MRREMGGGLHLDGDELSAVGEGDAEEQRILEVHELNLARAEMER